jgi:hypothetical protein
MKKRIYLDYDSTLIDFNDYMFEDMKRDMNLNFKVKEIYNYKQEIQKYYDDKKELNNEGYYNKANFFQGSIEFLKKLKKNNFEIVIITSSMSKEQKKYKMNHIKNNIEKYITEVIPARKKHIHSMDGMFIDDRVKNIYEHVENNETFGVLYNHENIVNNEEDIKEYKLQEYKNYTTLTNYDELFALICEKYKIIENKKNKTNKLT